MKPAELVTLAQIAERAGVSLFTVRQWVYRYPAFPSPWRSGRTGEPHLYLWVEVASWLGFTGRGSELR